MSTYMKPGQPWLYDSDTGDIVGVKDADGGESGLGRLATDANGNTVLVGSDGNSVFKGPMESGVWFSTPSIFRLRLTGTGTVTLDAKNSLGTITLAVSSYTLASATDQIEFPYAGDNAVAVRATLTGTATAEVI